MLSLDGWGDDAWGGDARWLADSLRFMAREAESLRPGGETVITRLADILVIQMLRHWIEAHGELGGEASERSGWLSALSDPRLGRAMAAMHREPGAPWTLAALAKSAAMSRSAFAARFSEVVGEPAMAYLACWRLASALTHPADERRRDRGGG